MMLQDFPYQYVAATAMVAFACAYFSHAASLKAGLVDKPDERKLHDGHVPLAGGPMVFATFVIAVFAFGPPVSGVVPGMAALVLLAVVFLVGLYDDYVHLRPSVRLFIQAICGLLMPVIGGVSLHGVGDLLGFGPIELGYLAVPLTALSFAGLVNAYNMIDGADGLCAGLALLPVFVLAVLAWHVGEPLWFVLATAAIALGVFLVFNLGSGSRWLPKVFLGDSGSGMLGFLVCAVLVYFSQAPQMLVKPVTCLWLVAVPLMDMLATMAIRLREGHHPMRADRRHLHHMLQDLGLGRNFMRRVIFGYAVLMALAGLLLMPHRAWVSMAAYLLLFALHLYGVMLARRAICRREAARQLAVAPQELQPAAAGPGGCGLADGVRS